MAAFAHRDHFSSTNSREAKNNLCIGVVRLIVEPNEVPPNDNRHSSMRCAKLGERELIIAFSWMTQLIQANPQFSGFIEIIVPGSEIPSWFMNQSVGGRILFEQSVGGRIRGFIRGTFDLQFTRPSWVDNGVNSCGYCWVHKQDLQEFNFMYPGNSSALKRKFFAIEDIHSSD
ncbi:hypothetical protein QL285_063933 [Trifolium repens]|nr:hypothetical protein QL285_063933 [Trifolium repens]